jgi:hypothetical protein
VAKFQLFRAVDESPPLRLDKNSSSEFLDRHRFRIAQVKNLASSLSAEGMRRNPPGNIVDPGKTSDLLSVSKKVQWILPDNNDSVYQICEYMRDSRL